MTEEIEININASETIYIRKNDFLLKLPEETIRINSFRDLYQVNSQFLTRHCAMFLRKNRYELQEIQKNLKFQEAQDD